MEQAVEQAEGSGATVTPLKPVGDEKSRVKLNTIQAVGLSIEQKIDGERVEFHVRRGVIAGLVAGTSLVDKVMAAAQRDIDSQKPEEQLDGEVAKVVLRYLQRVKDEHFLSVELNKKDLQTLEGKIQGLEVAVDHCALLFKQEDNKAKQRANDFERNGADEGGRPLPIRELREQEEEVVPMEVTPSSANSGSVAKKNRRSR